jgi:ferredoxin-NADP reductase
MESGLGAGIGITPFVGRMKTLAKTQDGRKTGSKPGYLS